MKRYNQGFTLTEVLITVVILAILAAAALANYGVTVQRARWDSARSVLIKIFAGERFFYSTLSNTGSYFAPPGACAAGAAGAACRTSWINNFQMDDPNINDPVTGVPIVGYTGVVVAVPPTFIVTATLAANGQTQTVDQDRTFGGTWTRP